ncbi:MAG: hypothetical protein WD467_00640 [Candidatus Saccharimonadales bacterium]
MNSIMISPAIARASTIIRQKGIIVHSVHERVHALDDLFDVSYAKLASDAIIWIGAKHHEKVVQRLRAAVAADRPDLLVNLFEEVAQLQITAQREYDDLVKEAWRFYDAPDFAKIPAQARAAIFDGCEDPLVGELRKVEQLRQAIVVAERTFRSLSRMPNRQSERSRPKSSSSKVPGVCRSHNCSTPHASKSEHDRDLRTKMRGRS